MSDKELNTVKDFEPSHNQLKYFKVFLTAKSTATKEEIAKEAGVTRKCIWEWWQRPEFCKWFGDEIANMMKVSLPEIWKTLLHRASKGDIQAIKLYLQRFDPDYTERKEKTQIIKFDEDASNAAKKMAKEELEKA